MRRSPVRCLAFKVCAFQVGKEQLFVLKRVSLISRFYRCFIYQSLILKSKGGK